MAEIWLSVVMPTYNGVTYLPYALASLRAQTGDLAGMEVLAVDDGSTDGTTELLQEAAHDLPIRVVSRPHTGNWVANANLGIALARGEYVGILHQDDIWMPNRLETLSRVVRAFPDAPLIVHPSWYIDAAGRKVGLLRCPLGRAQGRGATRITPEVMLGSLLVQNSVAMPGHLMQRAAAMTDGGLDESLWYSADWDLWLRLSALGDSVFTPEPLTACRLHSESQTMSRGDLGPQLHAVLDRHLPVWSSYPVSRTALGAAVIRAARLSADVNDHLACGSGGSPRAAALVVRFLALGPRGWWTLFRYSCLAARVSARITAGLW
jgi:Glycosyl transferase family 2